MIGDGPERPRLAALVDELGLGDRVELAGQLEHAEALRRARTAWLFVMPSIDEAFGVAYIEAMAAGDPGDRRRGRARPGGDPARAIELVAPGDPPALAATIARVLADPDELGRGGAARTSRRELHLGARAGRGRSPPTPRRSGEAGPVR